MNKNKNVSARASISRPAESPDPRGKRAIRARRRTAVDPAGSASPVNNPLPKDAKRLLLALVKPDAWAFIDPTDDTGLILGRKRPSVSVGAGRFSRQAADVLVRRDLACWHKDGRLSLQATEAGRAHLRRAGAPDRDDAFFHQHHETASASVETESGRRRVQMNIEESPLDWLFRRKGRDGERLIGEAAYQAGERLRGDIMLAGLLPSVTARWNAMPAHHGPASPADATDRMIAARQRIRNAFDAVGGDFSDLLLDLCGFLKGLELIERERHWPPRSAKVVVRLALTRLAEHYGIEAAAQGPAASRGIRAWQAAVIAGGRA